MRQFVEIELRGTPYRLSPLTLAQLERHEEAIIKLVGEPSLQNMKLAVPAFTDALRENHPDITEAQVMDLVDLATFRSVLEAMMGVSGLRRAAPGETKPQSIN